MYILNPKILPQKNIFRCNGIIANFLIENGVPLLAGGNREFLFSKTKLLEETLKRVPFWYKIFKYI